MKILTGVIAADSGTITLAGQAARVGSPAGARAAGLASVFQDPALVPDLTVRQNMKPDRRRASTACRRRCARWTSASTPTSSSATLPLAMLRMIDLARALSHDPQLLLLDEITAALPSDLAERVLARLARAARRGGSVLFVSHRLAEVTLLCDRATVLRDGRAVGTLNPSTGGEERIVELMLGESQGAIAEEIAQADETARPRTRRPSTARGDDGPPALKVTGLKLTDASPEGVDFEVRSGEIVGVAALDAQGQEELFDLLAGQQRIRDGQVERLGKAIRPRDPYDAIKEGMVLVPSDRLLALLPDRPIRENIAAPLYARPRSGGRSTPGARATRSTTPSSGCRSTRARAAQARRLSGGNQQKLTIARWLAAGFDVLLCFDPTRGIDVGTKRQIYALLRELAGSGAAVLLFTSELTEIQLVCDRVLVLHDGGISDRLPAAEATEARLLRSAHGLVEAAPVP